MKKIHYDTNTVDDDLAKIIGIYDDAIHGKNIPSPVVEIDEATWRDIIDNNGDRRRVDVNTGEIKAYTPPPKPQPYPTLSRVQLRAALEIDLGHNAAAITATLDTLAEDSPEARATKQYTRLIWENETRALERHGPFMTQLEPLLNHDPATIDAAWRAAAEKY